MTRRPSWQHRRHNPADFILGAALVLLLAVGLAAPRGAPNANWNQPASEAPRLSQAEPAASVLLGAPHGSSRPQGEKYESSGAPPPLTPIAPRPPDVTGANDGALALPAAASQPVAEPIRTSMPAPTSGIGSVLIGGWATWYEAYHRSAAAGPALRAALGPGWRGTWIAVQSGERTTLVVLGDWCACGERHGLPTLIDLPPLAMAELEPDWRRVGVVPVSIELPDQLPRHPDDDRMRLEVRDDGLYR